jgi:hypothetical protein
MGRTPGLFKTLNNCEKTINKTCMVPCQQGGVGRSLVPCTPYESLTGEGMYIKVLKKKINNYREKNISYTKHILFV